MDRTISINGVAKKVFVEDNMIKIQDNIISIPINDLGLLGTRVFGVIYQEEGSSEEIIIEEGKEVILDIFKEKGFEIV